MNSMNNIRARQAPPFRAALFDLDGTLLDSLGIWSEIDKAFFASRGMRIPDGFGKAIAGKSYRESAEYTVAHYLPNERWEDIVQEWIGMVRLEYAEKVQPKSGAVRYVRMLKRCGVRLAVATALPPELYEPCLNRLSLMDLFDCCCSTEHTGGSGKQSGEVYALAAQKLGIENADCMVFEDVPEGILGAKRLGMQTCFVRNADGEALCNADYTIWTFDDLSAVHSFLPSPRCVIFTAWCEGDIKRAYQPQEEDLVLCADAGWKKAMDAGVTPNLVIGDFDSAHEPQGILTRCHPVMKDDTDTMLCVREGLKRGYERFLIIGGFGGRLDHTLANLQTLAFAACRGAQVEMADGVTWATVVRNGEVCIPRRAGKLSLFSMGDRCDGVTIRGALYNLENGSITNQFPIGVSNEFAADEVVVSVRKGLLLILSVQE